MFAIKVRIQVNMDDPPWVADTGADGTRGGRVSVTDGSVYGLWLGDWSWYLLDHM